MNSFRLLNSDEALEIARKRWSTENMQKYTVETYDFYKTSDGLILELEKVNKITIDKTMYYDDEREAPEVNEANFITYNRHNFPFRDWENYLDEKKSLETNGFGLGCYDYKGIYFMEANDISVYCRCMRERDERYFVRYLTDEEQEDFINLMKDRNEKYIERLKKYYKRYGKHVSTYGYWANR